MKEFLLTIDKEQAVYLEKLTYETGAGKSIIDNMFTTHRKDADTSVMDSPIWKKYMEDYQKSFTEFEIAKEKLTKQITPIVAEKVGVESPTFDWEMDDFDQAQIRIKVYNTDCDNCK